MPPSSLSSVLLFLTHSFSFANDNIFNIKLMNKRKAKKEDQNIQTARIKHLRRLAEKVIKKIKQNELRMTVREMKEAENLFDQISIGQSKHNEHGQEEPEKQDQQDHDCFDQQQNPLEQKVQQEIVQNIQEGVQMMAVNNQDILRTFGEEQGQKEDPQGPKQYIVYDNTRKWNEVLDHPKLGKFEPQQKKILLKSFTQYIVQEGLDLQKILQTISSQTQKIPTNLKMWTSICSVCPNRSLKSSYKYLIRKFSTANRLGKWSQQQQQNLIDLHTRFGNKWTLIARQLGRTPENIRDKFRCLKLKSQEQQFNFWKFQDLISFMTEIQKMSNIKFMHGSIDNELKNAENHNQQQAKNRKQMNVKYNSKMSIHHNNVVLLEHIDYPKFNNVDSHQLKWKQISDNLKKTQIQCKNKYFQIVKIVNRDPDGKFGVALMEFLQLQKPQSEKQIDWKKWNSKKQKITTNEAKNRWFLLKKKIDGRSQMSFSQILEKCRDYAFKRRNSIVRKKQREDEQIDRRIEKATLEVLEKGKEIGK